jgi:hypothetical protein
MKVFQESPPNRYCRLFPPAEQLPDPGQYCETLRILGAAMIDDGKRVSEERPEILVETGYTYFGQLVAHDLTKDVSSIEEAWRTEPTKLENLQTPRLDLSVLYGHGPIASRELYEKDGVRLRTGPSGKDGRTFDVCVGREGERILADDRGAENLILRQMTAVFCRLHNFAIEQFRPQFANEALLFERARQQTRWQFQYLVVRDYLRTLLDLDVYKKIFDDGRSKIKWKIFSVPIEFAAAAMRFGHAMVRPNYLFSFGHEMQLQEVLGRTPERGPISAELEINWGFFFQGAGPASAIVARPIDTRLASPFQKLPPDLIGVPEATCPHAQTPPQLAVRTLWRGAALKLPSGQTVAHAFSEAVLSESEMTQNSLGVETRQGAIAREAGLARETPLWYYILKESEVRHNGNRLGPIGSYLVAETILAALRSDPSSYVHRSEHDCFPPIWKFRGGERRIHGLSELFRLAPIL